MKETEGGVTAAQGFYAAAAAARIKYEGRDDMALVWSDRMCSAAGTFTRNVVKAAPVIWDGEIVRTKGTGQAVIVNSGIANACTGALGLDVCRKTAEKAAELLGCDSRDVFVASTGVIGYQIPMDRICTGIGMLAEKKTASLPAGHDAARAIMTTDTVPKEIGVEFMLSGKKTVIGGMCKGAGMICPNMSTMLCFLTTDAAVSSGLLQKALSRVIPDTFNMVSVDGDTSTNDTVLLLANGAAGNPLIEEENADYEVFCEALTYVCAGIAKKIAADGEGASAMIEMNVIHAASKQDAKLLAKSVVCSNLTKAAVFGHDANWGRVLCALGYSGVIFDPEKVDLTVSSAAGSLVLVTNGSAADYSEETATRILSEKEVTFTADMKAGQASASAWGCDLTYDYVKINGDYRS